jgi:hypothetical protein
MKRAIALGIVAATALLSSVSYGQSSKRTARDELRTMVGSWQIARLDEWPDTCALQLSSVRAIGGYAVVLGSGCDAAFARQEKGSSWSADIYAWRPAAKGTIVLADAVRHSMITFTHTRMGTGAPAWIGHGPDGQDYELIRTHPPRQHKAISDGAVGGRHGGPVQCRDGKQGRGPLKKC